MDQIYKSLPTQGAIRLLRIQPGLPEESIRCYLEVFDSLEAAPPYEALSYVWGPKEPSQHILLNEEAKPVTPNLYDALIRLRPRPGQCGRDSANKRFTTYPFTLPNELELHAQESRRKYVSPEEQHYYHDISDRGISDGLVWIDALSVNQNDVEERGRQVTMMSSIYGRAKQVIVWLGKEDEHIPHSMPLMGILAGLYTPTEDDRGVRTWSPWDEAVAQSHQLPNSKSLMWSHLARFLSTPWFTRIWVLQELLLASNVSMCVGRFRIEHQVLDNATHNIYRYLQSAFTKEANKGLAGLDVMFKYPDIQRIKHSEAVPLGRLLQRCRIMDAGDARDKVFAVLSLSTVGQGASIPKDVYPNYSKTRFEVYRDAARHVMAAEQTLKYLVFSIQRWGKEKPASWVSDLDRRFEDQQYNDLPWKHNAGGNTPFLYDDGDHANELRVHGYHVERVVSVLDDLTPVKQENLPSLWKIIEAMQKSCIIQGVLLTSTIKVAIATWLPWLENSWHGKGRGQKDLLDELDNLWSALEAQDEHALPPTLTDDLRNVFRWSFGRRFFQTQDGRLGLGPPRLEIGDGITVLHGGPVLYALRRENDYFRFIGDCAMEDLMDGERLMEAKENNEEPMLLKMH